MKQTIQHLREEWWGNDLPESDVLHKKAVNCQGLFNTAIRYANQKFIPLCEGISGTIGNLVVDPTYQDETVALPIDTLVLDLTKQHV